MTKQEIIAELVEEFRTNSALRRRLGIEEGQEVSGIAETADSPHSGLSWSDKEGVDVAIQVYTSLDDHD